MNTTNQRFTLIDQIRGIALFLMIIFHTLYDLNFFKIIKIPKDFSFYWFYFPRIIVALFLFTVGCSLCLRHFPKIQMKLFLKRVLKIIFFAILISIVTYVFFPNSWVYWGTLHNIAFCSILGLIFLKLPKVSFFLGSTLFLANFYYPLPWIKFSHLAMDYVEPFPWFCCTLFGITFFHLGGHHISIKSPFLKPLEIMGRHSLLIYLIHQPFIFFLTKFYILIS